jgi:hypothetical protein
MLFVLFVVLFAEIDNDLPFADTADDLEPDAFADAPDDVESSPSPVPQPPVIIPFEQFLGIKEIIAITILIISILFYIFGMRSIRRSVTSVTDSYTTPLRRYFYVVPDLFNPVSRYEYHSWITGRCGYIGGFVTIRFWRCCEPLAFLLDRLLRRQNKVIFELVCEPEMQTPAIFSLRERALPYVRDYKLKTRQIDGLPLKLFTDFGPSGAEFINSAIEFNRSRPGVIAGIDLSDTNRFETQAGGRFVARFEFNVRESIGSFVNDELVDFVMQMADSFCKLHLTDHTFEKNVKSREELFGPPKRE